MKPSQQAPNAKQGKATRRKKIPPHAQEIYPLSSSIVARLKKAQEYFSLSRQQIIDLCLDYALRDIESEVCGIQLPPAALRRYKEAA